MFVVEILFLYFYHLLGKGPRTSYHESIAQFALGQVSVFLRVCFLLAKMNRFDGIIPQIPDIYGKSITGGEMCLCI